MRLLLLALAVTLTAGYSNGPVQFSPGKTYVFKYDVEIQTMKDRILPLARAGIKITSDVWLSATNKSVLLKFNNTVIYDSTGYSVNHWVKADRLSAELAPEFEKTIKFEYKNGNVEKISVPANSTLFTNNIKKSIVAAMQMTIKPDKFVYYLQEVGSQGTCKTTYLLKSEPGVTKVTKSRNLKECLEPVIKSSGLAYSETCPECLSMKRAISGSDTYKYTLNHTANGLVISSISSTEQILFNPLFDKNGGAIMESKQSLIISEVRDGPILPSPGLYWRTSPQYKFSNEGETFPFSLDLASTEAQSIELLEHLANNNNQSVDPRAPLEFAKLARLLHLARWDLMGSLWSNYSKMSSYRRVLRDVIPYEKSVKSLKFIMDKFVDGSLSTSEAVQMLLVSLQVVEADHLDALLVAKRLILDPKVIENKLVRRVSTLGAGSLTYRWCKNKNPCSASSVLDPLHEMLDRAILDSDSDTIRLVIKSLANTAHPSSLRKIVMLLPEYGHICGILEPEVIVDAALALRRWAKVIPKEVEQIATRLVLNKQTSPEIRMAGLMAAFDCNPSLGLVTTLATQLKFESSVQVRHFAVTLMRSLSMSTMPDRAKLRVACRHGLGILNTPFPRLRLRDLSTAFSRSVFYSHRMYGAALFAYALKNHITPVPKNSIFRLETLFAGIRVVPIELGTRINAMLESALKVTVDSTSREEKMIKIARILSSANPQVLRRFESEIYVAPWDQTVIYFDPFQSVAAYTAQRSVKTLIMDSLRLINEGFSWNGFKGMIPMDVTYSMATSTGFPFCVNGIISAVSSAYLHAKGRTSPPWSEDSQARWELSNITLKANARLSAQLDAVFAVGVSTSEIQAQLKTHARIAVDLPIAVEVNADWSKRKYSLTIKEVGQKNIISASTGTVALKETKMDARPNIRPIIPPTPLEELSLAEDTLSESIVLAGMPPKFKRSDRIPEMKKSSRTLWEMPGGQLVLEYYYRSTSSDPECYSCKLSGMNGASLSIKNVENKIKEIEITLGLGSEANAIMTEFNPIEVKETLEDTNMLIKLRKLLAPGGKNHTSSSSSSESYSASMSQSSSTSESSESSSSSTSSEGSRQTLQQTDRINFIPHQHAISTDYEATDASEITNTKYPNSNSPPSWSLIVETRRENGSKTAFALSWHQKKDQVSVRIGYINVSGRKTWEMHIEGLLERGKRIKVIVQWGSANQYEVAVTVESGTVDSQNATQLIVDWKTVPHYLSDIAARITKIIVSNAHDWGWLWSAASNAPKRIVAYAIYREEDVIIHWKTPHWNLIIPVKNPPLSELISEAYVEFNAAEGNLGNRMLSMISNTNAAKCSLVQDTVVTFNNRQFKSEMPHICNQVLAQDCTTERKFLVQLRKDLILNQNDINVLVADIDVSIHHGGNAIGVTVNGIEIPVSNLPYQHPTGTIRITKKDQGIALLAARHGLNEVFLDLNGLQIKIPDWMRGQTCGMCGRGDGEYIEEFHTPNGRLATNALSFTQSWVVPGTGCNDISKCYLATKSVKLDRQITLNGQESKCYSVEPVLRCQPGCTPVRTTSVQVGYHCVPAEASVNRGESLSSIFKKSVDVTEKAVAHLACRCNPQCA